ncbi:unnamed protein product, partial [marine sediment metagenome]
MKNRYILLIILISFLLFFTATQHMIFTQEAQKEHKEISISQWLLLGPFPTPLPALHKEYKKGYAIEGLLKFN